MNASDLLAKGASELGIEPTENQTGLFMLYLKELKHWNKSINLTALKEDHDIVIKHFIDSITPADLITREAMLLDIGSGAGFPGVPLKILRPDIDVVLLESSGKKAAFLKDLIRKLGLKGLKVFSERAENAENGVPKKSFDSVITRAVGSVPHVLELSAPYVKKGGHVLLMRGRRGATDKDTSEYPQNLILEHERHLTLPISGDERSILLFKSIAG